MARGTIVIDPFCERNLKTSSYDVTLGPWYWREERPSEDGAVHNMYDEESTARVWVGPVEAESARDVENRLGYPLKNIPGNARVILLEPGETILAHTLEFIGGRDICVAKMYARSSMGRNFIEVCKDAGWGDIGYFNRWTMEVTNNSRYFTIPLVVGRRVAQMVFYEVAPLGGSGIDPEQSRGIDYVGEGGKYQISQDIEEVKRSWHPRQMVPQMYKDWEVEKEK